MFNRFMRTGLIFLLMAAVPAVALAVQVTLYGQGYLNPTTAWLSNFNCKMRPPRGVECQITNHNKYGHVRFEDTRDTARTCGIEIRFVKGGTFYSSRIDVTVAKEYFIKCRVEKVSDERFYIYEQ